MDIHLDLFLGEYTRSSKKRLIYPVRIRLHQNGLPDSYSQERTYLATAHNTLILIIAERALVTYSNQRSWSNIAVADWAFAIAFVTETADGDTRLLSAHNKIAVRLSM